HTLPDVRRFAIDRHPARDNELFHFPAGTYAGLGQHLVQLGHQHLAAKVFVQALAHAGGIVQVGQGHIGFLLAFRIIAPGIAASSACGIALLPGSPVALSATALLAAPLPIGKLRYASLALGPASL